MKRIYLSSPTMHGEERAFIDEAFDTNWIAPLGPNVDAFEKEMVEYMGEGIHASALSAGTAAIHMALKCLEIKRGDIVFAPSLTFSATVNPVVYVNATPVFIDSEKDTWNMDPEALKKAFEKYPHPAAVLMVHLYGTPARIDEIRSICDEHGVPLVEDAAESLSSTYKGRQTGTFGDIGIISFNGNKIITSSGGGMMLSRNEDYTKKATFLSTQARDPARYYQHSNIGYNYRMSNVVAAIGRGQLKHLEEHKVLKKAIYRQYSEAFKDIPDLSMNPMNPDGDANNWLSCVLIDKQSRVTPDALMDTLDEKCNAETRPIWKPLHLQPVFEGCDYIKAGEEDVCAGIFEHGVCLPSDIKNTPEDMDMIIKTVRELFS
ncbi:MAG: aminotransferase class I/II-fold pyridoxal phosphate-dependent enzyme [Lachnospiraceae bacterium]|nr:aminotransferase class I/II-fold pyridoxal phosphate-dependent enzyme [Lachnospiraceae bacterium]